MTPAQGSNAVVVTYHLFVLQIWRETLRFRKVCQHLVRVHVRACFVLTFTRCFVSFFIFPFLSLSFFPFCLCLSFASARFYFLCISFFHLRRFFCFSLFFLLEKSNFLVCNWLFNTLLNLRMELLLLPIWNNFDFFRCKLTIVRRF